MRRIFNFKNIYSSFYTLPTQGIVVCEVRTYYYYHYYYFIIIGTCHTNLYITLYIYIYFFINKTTPSHNAILRLGNLIRSDVRVKRVAFQRRAAALCTAVRVTRYPSIWLRAVLRIRLCAHRKTYYYKLQVVYRYGDVSGSTSLSSGFN